MKSVRRRMKIQQEKPCRAQQAEQLQHGLIDHRRVWPSKARMPG